jgi:hypothetical protein
MRGGPRYPRGCPEVAVTPLGVKHALASKALVIIISYMIIIACNLDPFKFRVEKQLLKTQMLHLSAKE